MTEREFYTLNGSRKPRLQYRGEIIALSGMDFKEKLLRVNNPNNPQRKFWVRFENVKII